MEDKAEGPPTCSCGRDIVKYQCVHEGCPNIETQKFYCAKCLEDFEKHAHKPQDIKNVQFITDLETRWKIINDEYS